MTSPRVGHDQAAEHVQQRRLARARRSDQGEALALADREVDVASAVTAALAACRARR